MPSGLPPVPLCHALILARSVFFDSEGHLWINGPYWYLEYDSFPALLRSLEVYAVLTEGTGDVIVELLVTDVAGAHPAVCHQLVSVHFADPLEVREIIFHNFFATFPTDGEYRVQLFIRGPDLGPAQLVSERKLVVGLAPPTQVP
jgi:hypothetical protein